MQLTLPSIAIILFLFLTSIHTQEIVDYSHTASLQKTQLDANKTYHITIPNPSLNSAALTFPQACTRNKELLSSEVVERDRFPLTNQQEYLTRLKHNMTHFLKLSQKIKNARTQLSQYSLQISTTTTQTPLDPNQLHELQQLQNYLISLNTTIEDKAKQLSHLILDQISRTKDSGFDEIRLNFQHSSLQARLRYLQELKKNRENDKRKPYNDNKADDYFDKVNFGFNIQKDNLRSLQELLSNFAKNSALKLRITNQAKKLQAKRHIIDNKQQCRIRHIRPINQNNRQHILQITQMLRTLKKIQSGNREHCQGVAQKLLNQIKKVLKAYNYSHVCSQGLEDLKQEVKLISSKLADLQNEYNNLQYDPNFKKIQLYFNQTRQQKQQYINQIQSFDINLYHLNPSILDVQIDNLKDKLKSIRYQLQHPPEGNTQPFDHQKVRERIKEINRDQYKYCELKEKYQEKYRAMEQLVRKYQFRVKSSVESNGEYLVRVQELEALEREFNSMRGYLLAAIQ